MKKNKKTQQKKNDFESKFMEGHFVGINPRNAEILVMTAEGVLRGNTWNRMPVAQRWKQAMQAQDTGDDERTFFSWPSHIAKRKAMWQRYQHAKKAEDDPSDAKRQKTGCS